MLSYFLLNLVYVSAVLMWILVLDGIEFLLVVEWTTNTARFLQSTSVFPTVKVLCC